MAEENRTKDWLPIVEGWTRFLFFVVATIAAAVYSYSHLTKFDAEQTLRAKLRASTTLKFDGIPAATFTREGTVYCEISGSYTVSNTGEYNFYADEVTFRLFELPLIKGQSANPDEVVSFAMSERIEGAGAYQADQLGETVRIDIGESFAPQNDLQRSFGFVIPIDTSAGATARRADSNYVVIANASARLDSRAPSDCPLDTNEFDKRLGDNPGLCFHKHDLQHYSGTIQCNPQSQPVAG